jgi:hypothetical protein
MHRVNEKREREKKRERPVVEHSLQRASGGPHAREGAEKDGGRCTGNK